MPGGGPPRRGDEEHEQTEDAGAPGHLRRNNEQEVESVLLNQQPMAAEDRAPRLPWWPTATSSSTPPAAAAPPSSGTAGITSSAISFSFPSNFTSAGELLVPQRAATGGRRWQQQHGGEELPPESSTRSRMAEKLLENFDGLSPTTSSIFSSSTSSRETSIGGFLQPAPSSSPMFIYGQQQRQGGDDAGATMRRGRTTMEQGFLVGSSSTTATRPAEQQGVVLAASVLVMPTLEEQETCRGSERPLVDKQESTTRGITTGGDYSASLSPGPRTELSSRPAAPFDPWLTVAAANVLHLLDFSSLSDEEEQRAGTTAPACIDQHRVTESSGRDEEEEQEEVLPFLEEQEPPQDRDAIPRPREEEHSSHLPAAGGARERRRKRRQQEEQYQSTAAYTSATRKRTRIDIVGPLDTRATKTDDAVTTTTTTTTKDRRSAGHDDGSRRRRTNILGKKEQQSSTATSSSERNVHISRDPRIIVEGRRTNKEDCSSDGGPDDEDDAKLPAQNFAFADASSPRTWTRRDRQSDLPMGSTERSPGGEKQEQPRGVVRATSSSVASSQHQEQPARLPSPSAANDRKTKKWDEHYRDLLAFKQEHGHCNVPFGHIEHPFLGHWVKRQRYQYKRKTKGEHSQLTDQRQQLLDDVGFVWDSHAGAWEEQFALMQQHWKANGHCFVAAKDNKELNAWSKRQRRHYRLYQTNPSKSTLTDERIRRLDELNFPWQLLSSSGEPKESSAASAADTTSDSVVARSRSSTSR